MAIDPTAPPAPWAVPEWDDYINTYSQPVVPPAPVQLATPIAPPTEEVPQGAVPQHLTAAEEAQIEIDPQLSPQEEAQIEIGTWPATPPPLEPEPTGVMTPPYLGEVDAISTAGNQPVMPDQQVAYAEAQRTGKMAAHQTSSTPQLPIDYATGAELAAHASNLSPEQQVQMLDDNEQKRIDFEAKHRNEILDRQQQLAEENARVRQAAIQKANERAAQLDAEARALADQTPMERMTDGQKLASVIAGIVGGFAGMHQGGGKNLGVDVINQIANDAAQRQQAKLQVNARQRAAIGEEMSGAEDAYRAAEAVRLATFDVAIKKMESDIQLFDPRGASFARILPQLNQIKAQRAAAAAKSHEEDLKFLQQQFTNRLAVGELDVKVDEQNRKWALDNAKRAGAGAAKPVKFEDMPRTLDELRGMGVRIPDDVRLPPGATLSLRNAKSIAETAKSGEDWAKAARENSPEELGRQHQVHGVVDDQGDPIPLRNPEKVAKVMAAGDQSVRLIDQLITAREKYGWSSDLMKSPEWREMQSDFANLILEKKNIDELGVIAGPDMDLMQKAIGTTDPTEVRDPTPGLRRIRNSTVEKINTTLRYEAQPKKGRKVQRWQPPAPPPEAPKSASDVELESLVKFDPGRTISEDQIAAELGVNTSLMTGAQRARAVAEALSANDGLLPSVKERIDRLAEAASHAETEDAQRAAAAQLNQIADKAVNSAVREYAMRRALPDPGAKVPAGKE